MTLRVSTERREKLVPCKIKAGRGNLHELKKRNAFGEISIDIYQQFSMELTEQKEAILLEN